MKSPVSDRGASCLLDHCAISSDFVFSDGLDGQKLWLSRYRWPRFNCILCLCMRSALMTSQLSGTSVRFCVSWFDLFIMKLNLNLFKKWFFSYKSMEHNSYISLLWFKSPRLRMKFLFKSFLDTPLAPGLVPRRDYRMGTANSEPPYIVLQSNSGTLF